MSIKEISTYIKHKMEYESPDGDRWEMVVVINTEHADRKYVQYQKIGSTDLPNIIDGPMLLAMADAYRKKTSLMGSAVVPCINPSLIPIPSIVDHRALEKRSNEIQQKVNETMQNQDSSVEPIQSFSPSANTPNVVNDYTEFRTGLKPEAATAPVSETPTEWSVKKPEEELKPWQKDAQLREKTVHPPVKKEGDEGLGFKRIGAKDII